MKNLANQAHKNKVKQEKEIKSSENNRVSSLSMSSVVVSSRKLPLIKANLHTCTFKVHEFIVKKLLLCHAV